MKNHYDAIVTDASQRVSLELTRALGERGLRILNVEKECYRKSAISSSSRYSSGFELVLDYSSDRFLELCEKATTVFPVSTNTNIAVYNKAVVRFPEKFLLPPLETFYKANSKPSSMGIVAELGIPCPMTLTLKNGGNPPKALNDYGFPVVLKLANDENLALEPQDRYGIAGSEKDAEKQWNRLKVHGKDILVQEYLSGGGFGWSAIYDRDNRCSAEITHMRLREYPVSGGPSSYCMTVKDDIISSYGRKILDHLKWTGPAMVEFKKNSNGEIRFLEINPRYWGSLPLARHAGINIPYIHYQLLTGIIGKLDGRYMGGVKTKFRGMDLMAGLQELEKSSGKIGYSFKFICDFLNPFISDGIFSLKDPLPGIVYVWKNLFRK
ncbi:MAG TPA: hypothetical protein DET40_11425 [Lentisphaeria bacterium]|nr:MAG: hypothetical protein A2X45_19765 [Lentisphaerae bacterium GWF2_50_93]HCE44150.1 hypothetical protein [Lentisphaeria bacterium]